MEVHIFSKDGPIDLIRKEFWVCQGATICWRVSSGRLKICCQFGHTGMTYKADKVLSISVGKFSYLPSFSPTSTSSSEYEDMLTTSLLKTLTGKNLSCMAGLGNPCSYRTVGSTLPNWMRGNLFVWQEMWFVLTTSSKSNIIIPSLISRCHYNKNDLQQRL